MRKIHKDSADYWFENDVHFESRTIFVGSKYVFDDGNESGVDCHLAEALIKGLYLFRRVSDAGSPPVTLILNNPGGSWYHGLAIYDFIKSCPFQVNAEVYGHAMSMGSVILQAADKRIMSPDAKLMIHDGYMGMGEVHPKIFEAWGAECKKTRKRMYEIYQERTGTNKTLKYWERVCAFDKIYNSEEALKEGLIDEILKTY